MAAAPVVEALGEHGGGEGVHPEVFPIEALGDAFGVALEQKGVGHHAHAVDAQEVHGGVEVADGFAGGDGDGVGHTQDAHAEGGVVAEGGDDLVDFDVFASEGAGEFIGEGFEGGDLFEGVEVGLDLALVVGVGSGLGAEGEFGFGAAEGFGEALGDGGRGEAGGVG